MDAVPFDALRATREFDDARAWLEEARHGPMAPIAAEVWALDHEHRHVLLVRHRRRGWVPPGGKVDFGETPIEAAARELLEETGVAGDLDPVPAAVSVRSYRSDWDPSLGLSYVATIGRELPLAGEDGQPAAWIPLEQEWETVFAEDRDRIREHVRWSASQIGSRPRWPVGSVGSRGRVGCSVRIWLCSATKSGPPVAVSDDGRSPPPDNEGESLSYDVVALVAGRPDEQAMVHALQDVDPELRLHWHGNTEVLQVRDQDGRLLATLEPAREVERTDDVVRLLGEDVVAGLPESYWWVETRARPDEQGREVAHRFSDGLALRLGGAVWTSGIADFDLWEDTQHPAAERTADRALLVAQDRDVVPFSSWLSDTVATHGREKTLQVLTPATTRLTYATRAFLAGPSGRWVVQGEDGGHFDGLTGLAVHWDKTYGFRPVKEPIGPKWTERHPDAAPVSGFLADFAETSGTHLVVDVSVLHQDPFTPELGRATQIITEHLTGAKPSVWGPHEPALMAWDRARIAKPALQRRPRPWILYLSGPLGREPAFSGQFRLSWRGRQVLERISVVIGFENENTVPFEGLPTLVEALAGAGLLEALRVRRLPGRPDLTYEPVWTGPAVPVGMAIGPEHLLRIGPGAAQAGPIPGVLLGEGDRQSVWYPVLEDAAAPMRALELARRQSAYLSASA